MKSSQTSQARKRGSFYGPVIVGVSLYGLVLAFPVVSPILLSFLLTLLFAFALHPVVAWLRARSGKKSLALIAVIVGGLSVLGLVIWAFYAPLKHSALQLRNRLPEYWAMVQRPLMKIEHQEELTQSHLKHEVAKEVAQENNLPPTAKPAVPTNTPSPPGIMTTAQKQFLGGVAGSVKDLVANTATMLFVIVTVCFGTVLTLAKLESLVASFLAIIPAAHQDTTIRILRRIVHVIPRWLLATFTAMVTVGTLVFLAMWPLFGFTDALMLGMLAAVLEIIQFIGPVLMAIPALLLAINVGGWTPLWVVLIYLGIQILENNVISPLILAGQLKLQPVAVLFSILFCVVAFGVLGVLLAAPAVAIAAILRDELYRPRYLPRVSDEELEHLAVGVLRK